MKANELMIGDYVQVPELIDKVEEYEAYCKVKQLRITDLDVVEFKELNYDEIQPIPLTSEILKKIGFKEQVLDVMQLDEYKDGKLIYYIYWKYIDKKEGGYLKIASFTYEIGGFSRFHIKYVHELQHALRLCGIDKKIEL